MSKHTPTPWQVSGVRVKLGAHDCQAIGPDGFTIAFLPIGKTTQEFTGAMADAAFIVRAVNAHDALVDVLKAMREAYHDQPIGVWRGAIDAALRAAGVEP